MRGGMKVPAAFVSVLETGGFLESAWWPQRWYSHLYTLQAPKAAVVGVVKGRGRRGARFAPNRPLIHHTTAPASSSHGRRGSGAGPRLQADRATNAPTPHRSGSSSDGGVGWPCRPMSVAYVGRGTLRPRRRFERFAAAPGQAGVRLLRLTGESFRRFGFLFVFNGGRPMRHLWNSSNSVGCSAPTREGSTTSRAPSFDFPLLGCHRWPESDLADLFINRPVDAQRYGRPGPKAAWAKSASRHARMS